MKPIFNRYLHSIVVLLKRREKKHYLRWINKYLWSHKLTEYISLSRSRTRMYEIEMLFKGAQSSFRTTRVIEEFTGMNNMTSTYRSLHVYNISGKHWYAWRKRVCYVVVHSSYYLLTENIWYCRINDMSHFIYV